MADLSRLTAEKLALEIGAARLRELALEAELEEARAALPTDEPVKLRIPRQMASDEGPPAA